MKRQQRGITLLVALIMLVVMTLAAVMSFNLGRSNSLVVGNQQTQQITTDVARAAIEELLSRQLFADSPAASFGTTNTKGYDISGDGTADVTVALTPQPCIKRVTPVTTIDPNDPTTISCISGANQNFGVQGASTGGSTCADVTWEITAQASDVVAESKVTVVQGVRLRQDATASLNSANFCP